MEKQERKISVERDEKGRLSEIKYDSREDPQAALTVVLVGVVDSFQRSVEKFNDTSSKYANRLERLTSVLTILSAILVILTIVQIVYLV